METPTVVAILRPIPIEQARARKSRGDSRTRLQGYLNRLGNTAARNGQLALDTVGRVVGRFYRAELTSVFQHVVDARTGGVAGVEAFVRCTDADGVGLSPWQLFFGAADGDEAVALDRLCRTVHALNFLRQDHRPDLLFLQVHPRLVETVATDHGRAFANVLRAIGIDPARVVIELSREITAQPVLAAHASANYRWNGFLVALDFADPAAALQPIRSMRPDFLKFDLGSVRARCASVADVLGTAASLDVRVIATRCERPDDLGTAIELGVDLLQGYAASVPASEIFPVLPPSEAADSDDVFGI